MRRHKNNVRTFLVLIACVPLISFAQGSANALTKRLDEILVNSNFPGFAVAVTKDGKTLYEHAFGFSNRASKTAYTLDTIQPVGSVSKTVIGLALMKAVEQGVVSLDADVNAYLPFKLQNPHRPDERITLRHLATHTSGLLDNSDTYLATYSAGKRASVSMTDFLRDYYAVGGTHYSRKNFLDVPTGTQYAYSNVASALAAYIVELRTKTAFDEFTETQLFAPLGMESSHWHYRDSIASRYATLYDIHKKITKALEAIKASDGSLLPYAAITYPDGGLRTTAKDLIKYVNAMTNINKPENQTVLSTDGFSELFKKQFTSESMPQKMDRREPNRAVFWAFARNETIRHTGSDPGVFSFISFHPKTKIGRVFLMNAQLDGEDNEKVVASFLEIIAALDAFESSQQ